MYNTRKEWRIGGVIPLLLLMLLVAVSSGATQMTSQNYQILSSTVNSGGGRGSSANYGVQNSTGQPTPTGISQSASYGCFGGFQSTTMEEYVLPPVVQAQRGDVNGDGDIDILDVLAVCNHILGIAHLTGDALERADCNGDGGIDILDVIGIVNVILGIGECVPGAYKTEVTPEALEFLKALEPRFPAEEFARIMALVKEVQIPTEYSLSQNYPNPFNPITTIRYSLPGGEWRTENGERTTLLSVSLKIYNILGQEVKALVDEVKEAGYYTVTWDGRDRFGNEVVSGIYFYQLSVDCPKESGFFRTGQWSKTKRMVMLK